MSTWLYFSSDEPDTEIRVMANSGGPDHALEGMPKVRNFTGWALGEDGIFFLDRRALPVTIKFFDLRAKQIRQIVALSKPTSEWGGYQFRWMGSGWLIRKLMTPLATSCSSTTSSSRLCTPGCSAIKSRYRKLENPHGRLVP
jgi:hypothetical protein